LRAGRRRTGDLGGRKYDIGGLDFITTLPWPTHRSSSRGRMMSFRRYIVAAFALVALVPTSQIAFADSQPKPPERLTYKRFAGPARQQTADKQKYDQHSVLVRFKSGLSATTKDRA